MLRGVCIAVAVLALTSTPAFAQSTGTIVGTVTDAVTSAPLASGGSSDLLVTLLHSSGQVFGNQATNALGQYAFTGLTPGTYFVKVTTATTGYIPEIYNDIPCVAADCTAAVGSALTVAAAATVVANFTLSTGGGFSGTVRRASLSMIPVPGVSVAVYNAATSFIRTVTTASDGTYSVLGLPAGNYFALVLPGGPGVMGKVYGGDDCPAIPATVCRVASGTPIAVNAGTNTPGINFALVPTGLISGRIVEEGTDQPILASTRVELYFGDRRVAEAITSSGLYAFNNVPPGVYRLRTTNSLEFIDEWYGGYCVGCPGPPITVTVGTNGYVSGIDFALRRGGRITGALSCTASGATVRPSIYVYSADGTLVKQLDQAFAGCATGLEPTSYTIAGLHTGSYFLVGRDPAFVPFGTRLSGGILVDQLYSGIPCVASDCDPLRGVPVNVSQDGTTPRINFHFLEGAGSQIVTGHPSFGPILRMFDARGVELTNVQRVLILGGQQVVGIPRERISRPWATASTAAGCARTVRRPRASRL